MTGRWSFLNISDAERFGLLLAAARCPQADGLEPSRQVWGLATRRTRSQGACDLLRPCCGVLRPRAEKGL